MFRSIAIQTIIFIGIFNLISWFKASGMLSTDSQAITSYQLSTLMGKTIQIKANDKKTLIYFFAPWCQVCHLSIENLQAVYERNQEIDVIAIALDYVDEQAVKDFSRQHQLTFPIALGTEELKKAFKIKGYPSYYVLNEQNTIIARSIGYSSEIGLYLRSL